MKSSFLISIVLLSAAGALYTHATHSNRYDGAPIEVSVPETPVPETSVEPLPAGKSPAGMWAGSTTVYLGETFTLNFKTPHAQYLGVTDPGGHFYYVIFPKAYASEGLQPLINGEDFVGKKQLTIDPQTLRADPYTYGVTENQKVFTRSGVYTFILGENLHVDDPALIQKVTVQYQATKRPANAVAGAM